MPPALLIAVMVVGAAAVHLGRPAELRGEPGRLLRATLADERRGPFVAVPGWSPGEAGRVTEEDVERLAGR